MEQEILRYVNNRLQDDLSDRDRKFIHLVAELILEVAA